MGSTRKIKLWDHTSEDTPDKVDSEKTAKVIAGLEKVVADLVRVEIN